MNGILLSACLETETASAKTSQTNGLSAFTFGIAEALKEVGVGSANGPLMAAVQARLRGMGFRQTPLVKAKGDLAGRSFILFDAVEQPKPAAGAEVTTQDERIDNLVEALRRLLTEGKSMQATTSPMGDEKFFGAIFSAVATAAPHVLPLVMNALRKDFQPGLATQPAMGSGDLAATGGDEKFLGAIFSAVATAAPHVLPLVMNALRKDFQPGVGGTALATPMLAPAATGDEKFFGAIVSAVSRVAPHVLPLVMDALRKDFKPSLGTPAAMPAGGAGAGEEKFLGALFGAIASTAPHVLPIVMGALRKDFQPGLGSATAPESAEDAQDKLFGRLFRTVLTTVPQVLPQVLSALGKDFQPGLDSQPTDGMGMAGGQEGDEKFFGAILSAVATAAPHVLPIVMSAMRKDFQPSARLPSAAVH